MRLYLNFILTVIAISLIVIIFKTNKIPSEAHAYGKDTISVKIVDIGTYLPSLPVEIVGIKKRLGRWDPIRVKAN